MGRVLWTPNLGERYQSDQYLNTNDKQFFQKVTLFFWNLNSINNNNNSAIELPLINLHYLPMSLLRWRFSGSLIEYTNCDLSTLQEATRIECKTKGDSKEQTCKNKRRRASWEFSFRKNKTLSDMSFSYRFYMYYSQQTTIIVVRKGYNIIAKNAFQKLFKLLKIIKMSLETWEKRCWTAMQYLLSYMAENNEQLERQKCDSTEEFCECHVQNTWAKRKF